MINDIEQLVHKVLAKKDIDSSMIPDLDLYIDQIITLLDKYLSENKRHDGEKILTKTMVNNYSKQGIIKPVKGKKYSKDHIIQMLMVYSLKNTLSIEEIKRILKPIYEQSDKGEVDLKEVYDRFLQMKHSKQDLMANSISQIIENENLDFQNSNDRLVTILCLCALSEFSKNVAQELVDYYFPIKDK